MINPLYQILKILSKKIDNFFASVGPKYAKNIPVTEKTFQDVLTSHNEQMQFEELKLDEFEEAFKNLKQNKITGFDDFHPSHVFKHFRKNYVQ